jgi:hypothetical protein
MVTGTKAGSYILRRAVKCQVSCLGQVTVHATTYTTTTERQTRQPRSAFLDCGGDNPIPFVGSLGKKNPRLVCELRSFGGPIVGALVARFTLHS